jgi:hypothetical protein
VAVLFGVQVALFGVLADLIVDVNREQTRQLERVAREATGEGSDDSGPVADPAREEE